MERNVTKNFVLTLSTAIMVKLLLNLTEIKGNRN